MRSPEATTTPRNVARRYYPGFCAAFFLVLLRVAIGWHFLYEGVEKVYSTPEGRDSVLARVLPRPSHPEPPFSAEGYLRASSGPLAPTFRRLVPDADSLEKLDPERLRADWRSDLERHAAHYRFGPEQRKAAETAMADRLLIAEAWFREPENRDKVQKYRSELAYVDRTLNSPSSLAFERERAYKQRRDLEGDRKALAATVDAWTGTLRDAWVGIYSKALPPDKAAVELERVGRPVPLWTRLDWINASTMIGMLVVGVGLILGFFTRLSALGAIGFLAMFYLSMPPWPHLPTPPTAEGHYLFVNKNLIELIACLALLFLPTGHWIGLDALLFGRRRRRRELAAEQRAEARSSRNDRMATSFSR